MCLDCRFPQHTAFNCLKFKPHSVHDFNVHLHPPRNMKVTILHNNEHTNIIISDPDITPEQYKLNITSNTFTLPLPDTTSISRKN